MKITIMRDQLVAALFTAAKEDIRTYLNGVYLEATSMETRLVSTNGHVLSVQRADAKGDNEVDGVIRMIVPRSVVEKVKKDKYLKTVEINDDGGKWGVVDFDTRTNFEPVDGKFPDYRRVIPSTPDGTAANFNPTYIALFASAAKILGATTTLGPNVVITHNGNSTALVSLGRDTEYFGFINPLKEDPIKQPPSWATSELTDPTEESLV